jgi:hypothetical protein
MKVFVFSVLLFIACACNAPNSKSSSDDFYLNKGGFDIGRIPLIKPYEATTPSTLPNWIVASVDTNSVPLTIPGTKEIRVLDSLIFVHSINTTLNYQSIKEAWFVIIPKKKLVKGFETHKKYLDFIKGLGLKKEPKLINIGRVFNIFDQNDTLNWNKIP